MNTQIENLRRKVYLIVATSLLIRVTIFFFLPNSASTLGPDEGQYAELVSWVSLNKPVSEYPLFGPTLYYSSRAIILPSVAINNLGLGPLNAIRLTATIYGFLIALIVAFMFLCVIKKNTNLSMLTLKNENLFLALLTAFVFLPSRLVWSTLGLRESATEFWTIVAFLSLFALMHLERKAIILTSSSLLISCVMVYSSRPQVGLVVSTSILIYLVFRLKLRISRILIPVVVVGSLIGLTLCSTPATTTSPTPATGPTSTPATGPTSTPATGPITPVKINFFQSIKNQIENLREHHEANKVGAVSAIKTLDCPIEVQSNSSELLCVLWRLPYTTATFVFRPLIGADVTSVASLFAAIENLLWLSTLLFVAVMFLRNRRIAFLDQLTPSLIFMSIYVTTAGAYEGNMGTAFRHKSLILWVVILLLASTIAATQQRKAEQRGISGSSQE